MLTIWLFLFFIQLSTVDEFRERTDRKGIQLFREKQLIAEDKETGGCEELVVVDWIEVEVQKNILIIEAKGESLRAVMGQCLLAVEVGGSDHWKTNLPVLFSVVCCGGLSSCLLPLVLRS